MRGIRSSSLFNTPRKARKLKNVTKVFDRSRLPVTRKPLNEKNIGQDQPEQHSPR
jgi:hypothetical protein